MNAEQFLAVLTAHVQSARNQRCTCGWKPTYAPIGAYALSVPPTRQHREHLAEVLETALNEPPC